MSALVFVDTNVLVYARSANEPHKQGVATEWIERLWQEQRGRVSMQVLSEYYVTLTRKIRPARPPEDAWDDVQDLLKWNPQATDSELLQRAHEIEQRYHLSWWDSLIVGAAQLQDCALLLTEDLQHGAIYGRITVRNPFTSAVSESDAAYTLTGRSIPRHPRRGRPRKDQAA